MPTFPTAFPIAGLSEATPSGTQTLAASEFNDTTPPYPSFMTMTRPDKYDLTFSLYSAAEPLTSDGGNLTLSGSGTVANIIPASGEGTIALSASGGMDANNVTPLAGEGRIELSGEGAIANINPAAGSGTLELSASGTLLPVSALQDLFSLTFNLYSLAEAIAGQGGIALTADGDLLALLPTDWPISGEGIVLITGEGAFTNVNPVAGAGTIRLSGSARFTGPYAYTRPLRGRMGSDEGPRGRMRAEEASKGRMSVAEGMRGRMRGE
jgi:hypothetical protein